MDADRYAMVEVIDGIYQTEQVQSDGGSDLQHSELGVP
jgi:hypothetical protein